MRDNMSQWLVFILNYFKIDESTQTLLKIYNMNSLNTFVFLSFKVISCVVSGKNMQTIILI